MIERTVNPVVSDVVDLASPDDIALADRMKAGREAIVTELRKVWIWLPSSSQRSCVRHLLRSARQPVAPISVQRVAEMGSSTARMISETRVSAEPRARR